MERRPSNESYRRRSPAGMADRRNGHRAGRARSRSPQMIDRYQPNGRSRDEYFEGGRDQRPRDDRRRQSPPLIDRYIPGQEPPLAIRTNPLPHPLTMDFQVGFNWFAEWWRVEQLIKEDKERAKDDSRRPGDRHVKSDREVREEREKERPQIQAAYDQYKEDLQVKMSRMFVSQHKDEEWFKERYIPELREPFKARLNEFRTEARSFWESDMDEGKFDDFTLEGIYKNESDGMGGVVEKEEGETVAAAEVLGVGDLVPSRGGDIRDESSLQPALLIKTLAPMVSRAKIENLCQEHLGTEDGGLKWLSLSDPNPQKKCHRIGWIMLKANSEEPAATERGDGRDEEGEDGMEVEPKPVQTTAEKALEAINGKTIEDEVKGNFTCHVGIHVPPREPRKKALWDLFSAPQRIERDLQLIKRLVTKFDQESGTDISGVAKVEARVQELRDRGVLQTSVGSSSVKKEEVKDEDMDEDGMEEGEEEEVDDDENDSEDLLVQKKTLDLLVEYLRRVYNFCFFCVFESDSIHELVRKCPGGHLRRPRASLSTTAKKVALASAAGEPFPLKRKDKDAPEESEEAGSPVAEKQHTGRGTFNKTEQQLQRAFNWVKTFEDKLLQILEPENVDIKKLGGKPVGEALDEELRKFVKQEDENKFRCKVPECTKLFKGENFWRKHVEKRHIEWFEEIRKGFTLVNAYVLDPSHIAPSRSDANSNGHFPSNNPLSNTGTPRGFNLQNMMQPFPAFSPNGFGGPPPQFGGHMVQPASSWGFPNGDDVHGGGPMRRGGGRFAGAMRSQGPYDRRGPRQGGNPMMGGGFGPMRGAPRGNFGGGGKWGDGGGVMNMGPKEAVQGRTLKKYDDLDAVDGAATGGAAAAPAELNY